MNTPSTPASSRRQFLGTTVGAASALTVAQSAWAAGSDQIKVGLIGAGGRGAGAANQALSTQQEGVVLHAVADAFKEKAEGTLSNLRTKHAEKVQVDESRIFAGLDGYKKVIDSCDLVILTTPPGFRPYHFEAAVNAGKHGKACRCGFPRRAQGSGNGQSGR
jgi:myo-inositol 2-dehydrogenase/D-chiro-inositol 1-dehydrogenase